MGRSFDEELREWLREAYLIGEQRHPAQQRYRRKPMPLIPGDRPRGRR